MTAPTASAARWRASSPARRRSARASASAEFLARPWLHPCGRPSAPADVRPVKRRPWPTRVIAHRHVQLRLGPAQLRLAGRARMGSHRERQQTCFRPSAALYQDEMRRGSHPASGNETMRAISSIPTTPPRLLAELAGRLAPSPVRNQVPRDRDRHSRRQRALRWPRPRSAGPRWMRAPPNLAQGEKDGRGGLEPVRYGDWEVKGLASDF